MVHRQEPKGGKYGKTRISDPSETEIDELRQDTLHKLIEHDSDYQDYCKEMTAAEREYTKLDLPQEQRQIVDEYLSLADMVNMEYCTFSYLAGIFDSHKIVDLFQLKEKNNKTTKQQNNKTTKQHPPYQRFV